MLNSDFVIRILVTVGDGSIQPRYWDGRGQFEPSIHKAHIYQSREAAEAATKRRKVDNPSLGYMTFSEAEAEIEAIKEPNEKLVAAKKAEYQARVAEAKAERAKGPKPEIILRWLTGYRDDAQQGLDSYAETFKKNPLYALENVDSQFSNAATLDMTSKYIGVIQYHEGQGTPLEEVSKDIIESVERDFIFRASLNTNFSTGQGVNLLEGARVVALGNFYRWLKGL